MDTAQLAEKLVSWIREQVLGAGRRGAVLGVSGGIDSSVLAVLCKRAFPDNVLGLILPCHSIDEDVEHAKLVAGKFSVPYRIILLDAIYDALLKVLPSEKGSLASAKLAEANLKPRLRMLTLYYVANKLDYLVVGSGNRSEIAIGYFTKHGDGGVDISPIGNLVKEQIRELARYFEIPKEIIDKPPSAGLWAGQTDEGEMGITYAELDRYLLTGEAPTGVKARIEKMIAASAHKRRLPPIPEFE